MAINRSKIARQLLAAGGVSFESPGNTTLQRVLPRMDGIRPGFYGPDMGEGGKESDFGQDTYSTSDVDFGGESGGSDAQFAATAEAIKARTPSRAAKSRADTLRKQLDYMYGNTNLFGLANPFKGPALNVYDKDFLDIDQYGMSGKDLTRSKNIQGALDTFQKTGQLSQDKFNEVFGAQRPTTPGGDNNPIPIIPKIAQLPTDIEPEKSDYDEFVQRFTLPERFRLRAGGSPGNTTLQRVLPRMDGRRPGYYGPDMGEGGKESDFGQDTYSTSDVDFGGVSGGSDADFAAARDAIYGTTRSGGGGTTNVTGFGPGGRPNPELSLIEKAKRFEQFDLINKEEEEKEKENNFGLSDLKQGAFDAGKAISQEGSLFDKALTGSYGAGAVSREQSLRDRFGIGKADGGDVRQAYGLGSLVKKVTGAVKKVAKSDIGKAALAGAAIYYGGGGNLFGAQRAGMSGFSFANLPGAGFFASGPSYKDFMTDTVISGKSPFSKLLGKIPGGGVTAAILGTSLAAGVLTPKQEEEVDSLSSRIADNTGIDVEQIRKEVQEAYASGNTEKLRTKYPFLITESAAKANGGRIGFENGGYSFEQFKKDKFKVDQFMGEEQMRRMYEEMMRKKRVAEQRSMAVDGGDIDEAPKEDMSGQEMASAVGDETDDISRQLFGKGVKDLTPDEFKELMDEIDRLQNKFRSEKGSDEGIMMMASNIENDKILEDLFEKYLDMGLSPKDAADKAREEFDRMSQKQGMNRMMANEGGLMNLGGNEMDLRGGGFVPLGVAEKADDVPARLSKNEFVFTADAVRAAGGGSVDRGADLMYKTMKQLENKVA